MGCQCDCLGRRVASCTTRDAKEIAKLLAMVSFLCFIAHRHCLWGVVCILDIKVVA